MKTIARIISLAALFAATPAFAATISLSPASVSVAPGQTVAITVQVDPGSTSISAVKSEISYPADLLTPTSFTYASTWIPLTQTGYDSMGNGTIVKSAGYPAGLSAPAALGTIVFTARAAGTATIAVENSSIAYDTANNNTIQAPFGSATVSIAGAAPQQEQGTAPTTGHTSAVTGELGTSANNADAATSTGTVNGAETPASQAAAVGAAAPSWLSQIFGSFGRSIVAIIVILAILLLGWLLWRRRTR